MLGHDFGQNSKHKKCIVSKNTVLIGPPFIPAEQRKLCVFVYVCFSLLHISIYWFKYCFTISLLFLPSCSIFPLIFPSSFYSISLLPRWQRLSWPPLTRKQAWSSWQPHVVHMKWCSFIFRYLPFKTIRTVLTGTPVKLNAQIMPASVRHC